jgi:hypothetical protein
MGRRLGVMSSCAVGDAVSEVDLEREQCCGPVPGSGPLGHCVLQGEVDELAGGVFAGEAALRFECFAELAVERLDRVGIRYERR